MYIDLIFKKNLVFFSGGGFARNMLNLSKHFSYGIDPNKILLDFAKFQAVTLAIRKLSVKNL